MVNSDYTPEKISKQSLSGKYTFSKIPAELKALPQWVLWKYETRDGKRTKVPYQANGKKAESNNPATWTTFNNALSSFLKFDGIGIMCAGDLAGIDIDHCIDDQGQISDLALSIMDRMSSYSEITPSGHGIRTFLYGKLPPGGRKDTPSGVEMYDTGRFFTVTGWHIEDTPLTVENRSEQVAQLHREIFGEQKPPGETRKAEPNSLEDQELIEKARKAKNGLQFDQLLAGSWESAGFSSQSEADLAFCSSLAFWTGGDAGRIDRIFRSSGLMRDKWGKRHSANGMTYGELTISKALESVKDFYHPNGYHTDNGGLADDPDPDAIFSLVSAPAEVPALPEYARIDPAIGAGACDWLDKYIDFSRTWSPRAADGFHEACALWVLSTVAARRVRVHMGKPRYANLFIALLARTSLYAKSSTAEIAIQLMRTVGLSWLLAADSATPQKFIADLTTRLVANYDELDDEQKIYAKLRVGMAGQRGWYYDEFGQHVSAMMRDGGFMADFRGLLRRMDDTPDRYEYGTIGRGNDVIERPYLALLANLTPDDLRPFTKRGAALWGDGFMARFALICPPEGESKRDRFPAGERIIPDYLLTPIREWHDRLGVPDVDVIDALDKDGKPTGFKRVEFTPPVPHTLEIDNGVREAFYTYHDALLDLLENSQNHDLDGNYARLAEKALRVATLLASVSESDRVKMIHWARAQAITERWRAGLHELYQQINEPGPSQERESEERLLKIVQKLDGATAAEAARYVRDLSSGEAADILDRLVRAGVLTSQRTKKGTNRYELPTKQA